MSLLTLFVSVVVLVIIVGLELAKSRALRNHYSFYIFYQYLRIQEILEMFEEFAYKGK